MDESPGIEMNELWTEVDGLVARGNVSDAGDARLPVFVSIFVVADFRLH